MQRISSFIITLFMIVPAWCWAQNVGVNNKNPQAKLHISGSNAAAVPLLRLYDSLLVSGSNHLAFGRTGTTQLWELKATTHANPSLASLRFNYGNLTRMNIMGNGLIGIGTSGPSAALHINSSDVRVGHVSTNSSAMYITLAENGNNNGYFGSFLGKSEDVDFGTYGGNNQARLHLVTMDSARLTVDSSGRVGIGANNSASALTIGRGLQVDALYQNGTVDGNGNAINNWLRFGSNSGEGIASNNNPLATNYRGIDLYTNFANRFCITNNGRLGIGTANPQAEVQVVGNIKAGKYNGIKQIMSGVATVGTSTSDQLFYTLNFGRAVEIHPGERFDVALLVTIEQTFPNVNDTFIAYVMGIDEDTHEFATIHITRLGAGANGTGWGQPLKLHWIILNNMTL